MLERGLLGVKGLNRVLDDRLQRGPRLSLIGEIFFKLRDAAVLPRSLDTGGLQLVLEPYNTGEVYSDSGVTALALGPFEPLHV